MEICIAKYTSRLRELQGQAFGGERDNYRLAAAMAIGGTAALSPSRSAPLRRMLLAPPVLAWAVHLAFALATAAITVALSPGRDEVRPEFDGIARYLVSPLSLWDGGWYNRVARQGYERQQSAAFWPLYPTLLDLGHRLTGLSIAMVGLVISNVAFLGALVVLFALVRDDYGQAVAVRTVWLAALWPLSFYFSAVYTESLFLLLTVGALVLARSGRWTGAALAAAMATLTRSTGLLILLPLGIMLVRQRGWHPRGWWTRAIQLTAAAATPLAFAVHLNRIHGDPLLMVRVQERWGRLQTMPWDTLETAIHRMHRIYATGRHSCETRLDAGAFHACRAALDLKARSSADDISFIATFGLLVLLPFAFWRLLPRDSLYLVAGLMVPLFSPTNYDPLVAMARYLIVLFPMYIVLAWLLPWRPLFVAVLIGSTAALVGLLTLFARAFFVA